MSMGGLPTIYREQVLVVDCLAVVWIMTCGTAQDYANMAALKKIAAAYEF